ncbi:hypothetical protein I3760_10G155300 [Carya illinoinensis]|nr:hypothetical protein I3760_10G155300 [Carya illinoinensis]
MREERAVVVFRNIPSLNGYSLSSLAETTDHEPLWKTAQLNCSGSGAIGSRFNFACVSVVAEKKYQREFEPTLAQLLKHPLAIAACVPKEAAIFTAGAISGAAAKTFTAPLERIKLLMQAITLIGKEEGIRGYWKGNLPQVIRVIPYSAVQLFAYETYKKLFRGKDGELSVIGRLAAGACAGMTSTFITYPLDVLRLRLAVEPGYRTMSEVALNMLREEGFASFYYGLGPSLIGIAPYIAVNFCVFDFFSCHSHMLSPGHREKTDANQGYTIQICVGCLSRYCGT